MKKLALLLGLSIASSAVFAVKLVNGYVKKDGTYVAPYFQTDANQTTSDNYSTRGNVNPYTGQPGYKPNDYSIAPIQPSTQPRRSPQQLPLQLYNHNGF